MASLNRNRHWNVELQTKGCTVSEDLLQKMDVALGSLRRVTQSFPVANLVISVFRHARSDDHQVKTSLVLMNTTLFTADHDEHLYPAFERCVNKLVKKVNAYVSDLANTPEVRKQQKGTHQDLFPLQPPDPAVIDGAIEAGDYVAFRRAADGYEGPVRDRVARWIERYPELERQLGDGLTVADVVEEVFLNAFERYRDRPATVRLGEWLDGLIDPSVRALLADPDTERQNIEFARTLQQAAKPQ